jgi:hypothetical protein
VISYDVARQLGKTYIGALNTGEAEFAALFAPDATVTVGGREGTLADVRTAFPPGRSSFRGARLEPPHVVFTVRVKEGREVVDRPHRLDVADDGTILALEA